MVACQFDEVGDDQRVDTLLSTRMGDRAQAELDVVGVGETLLLSGGSGTRHSVVPVDTEEGRGRRACMNRVS